MMSCVPFPFGSKDKNIFTECITKMVLMCDQVYHYELLKILGNVSAVTTPSNMLQKS